MQAAFGIALGQRPQDYSKPLYEIRDDLRSGYRNATQNVRNAVRNSVDALIGTLQTLTNFKIDLVRLVVDQTTSRLRNFINNKVARINAIRTRFRTLIDKMSTSTAQTTEEIEDENAAAAALITESLSELDAIKKEMEKYLTDLKLNNGNNRQPPIQPYNPQRPIQPYIPQPPIQPYIPQTPMPPQNQPQPLPMPPQNQPRPSQTPPINPTINVSNNPSFANNNNANPLPVAPVQTTPPPIIHNISNGRCPTATSDRIQCVFDYSGRIIGNFTLP